MFMSRHQRSVFAAIVNMMGEKVDKNKKMFHAHFDFADGDIDTLFTCLKKEYPSIDIHILFQHPSPGVGERMRILLWVSIALTH